MAVPEYLRCKRPSGVVQKLWDVWYRVDGKRSARGYHDRTSVPILAFVGANSSGKTWGAVYTVMPTLMGGVSWNCDEPSHLHTHAEFCSYRCGSRSVLSCDCEGGGVTSGERYVLSNIELFDPDTGEPHPRWVPLDSYQQLVRAEHCDILLDEATGVADAQDHASLPAPVRNMLAQQRKRDTRIVWTCPDYSNAHNRIRQVTQAVAYSTGGAPVIDRESGALWRQTRRLRWTLYATADFEVFSATQRMNAKPLSHQVVWRPGHVVDAVYKSLAVARTLGVATEGGVCLGCGGRRSAPKCECPPDPYAVPEGVEETVDQRGTRRRKVAA